VDRQGRGNGRTPSPGEQEGVEVPYCPPPYSRRSWTASAELKATTTTPRPTTAGSQAGQPEQEGRSDPGPGTTGLHQVEKQPLAIAIGAPGCQGCLKRHGYHHNVACNARRAKWDRIGRVRCLLEPQCCKSNSPKQSSEEARDPVTHGRSKLRDRLDRSGSERKRR